MQSQEIMQNVKETLISTMKISEEHEVDVEASLRERYGLDSMSSLMFLMALEEKIEGFMVSAENLEESDLHNIVSVTNYVFKNINVNQEQNNAVY